jgi:hypothetical protein
MAELSQALQATPEGRGVMSVRAALASSPTEFHEYQDVPTGAFTSPQFRDRETAGRAPTAPALSTAGTGPVAFDTAAVRRDDAPTRADTEAATAATVTPRSSRSGLLVAVIGLSLVGGGAAIYGLKQGAPTPATAVTAEAPPAAPPASLAVAPPAAPPATEPAPPASASVAPSKGIKLSVVTEPPGATLSKDGFQVCDKTPCEVMAAPNETLELEGVLGALKGKAKVLAQRDQSVTIKLAGAAPAVKTAPKVRMCEVEAVDGLKVLRPCP